jgi:hypothetical protein
MVHKSNGARAGYLIFSGAVVMLVCMTGLVPTVLHWVPLAVVAMVIVWFGLVMVGSLSRKFRKNTALPWRLVWCLCWPLGRCSG